ncbi:hypothetical protein [Xenorhabdus sp. KK7.4]|uniref:hypothetical protein n=1 Tax=Xenorhabdus sp. KK7.4 TaxID=1851572 RepID=UPI000C042228|nr:hypothetical protein [Xenorhabdus sp. KK7.4]PHM55204.1 phage tail protein [Xenorhabdus sp. KK7.4]
MTKQFKVPFAAQGDRVSVPDEAQSEGAVSYAKGYGAAYGLDQNEDPTAREIEREKMNGIFHDITEAVGEIQTFGASQWAIEGQPYPLRGLVYHKQKLWQSRIDNNKEEPKTGNAWVELKADLTADDVGAYSKAESDGRYESKGVSYTKGESDGRYESKGVSYTKGESDGRYESKGVSYTKGESDGRYESKGVSYTKGESDGRYESKGVSYTKAESDGRYESKGVSYTKAESDERYQSKEALKNIRWVPLPKGKMGWGFPGDPGDEGLVDTIHFSEDVRGKYLICGTSGHSVFSGYVTMLLPVGGLEIEYIYPLGVGGSEPKYYKFAFTLAADGRSATSTSQSGVFVHRVGIVG